MTIKSLIYFNISVDIGVFYQENSDSYDKIYNPELKKSGTGRTNDKLNMTVILLSKRFNYFYI